MNIEEQILSFVHGPCPSCGGTPIKKVEILTVSKEKTGVVTRRVVAAWTCLSLLCDWALLYRGPYCGEEAGEAGEAGEEKGD